MKLNGGSLKSIYIISVVILGILALFLIRPVLISIFIGLLLAYLFFPLYKKFYKKTGSKKLSAALVLIISSLIIIIPLWLIVPPLFHQVFQVFKTSQTINLPGIVRNIFPSASESFIVQATVTINSLISKISSAVLNSLINFFLGSVSFLLNLIIVAFVFFYSLVDSEKLASLARDLSPFPKKKEKLLVSQFKEITNSLLYGQIIIGIGQGIASAIGFIIFGIPNALVLTLLATIAAIIPIVGPTLVWVPITIYLFITGSNLLAFLFLAYNFLIVSSVETFLRPIILARRTQLSPAIALIGMIAGLFIFGAIGLIIGPLILAYFITFIQAYKEESKFKVVEKKEEHGILLNLINLSQHHK